MSRASPLARVMRRWHKRLGLAAAAFLVFLALSGLALNHGEALRLDAVKVSAPWLMAWYGLKPSVPQQCYPLAQEFFCWQDDVWTLGGAKVPPGRGEPVGAVRVADQIWVATAAAVYLYGADGRLVDQVERDLLPGTVLRLGVRDGKLAALIAGAARVSSDGIAWERLPADAPVSWSRPAPLPEARQRELAPLYAPSLPLQRVVADLHSGRIFGRHGVLVTDALAAILVILGASGVWLYLRERRSRRASAPAP